MPAVATTKKKGQQISPALFASIFYFFQYFSRSAIAALGVAHSAAGHVVLDPSQALPEPLS